MISSSEIKLCLKLFRGREEHFAQQGDGFYFPVRRPLGEFDIRRHLDGDMTCGLYLLNSESCCHLICIDIDIPKGELDKVDFTNPGQKYAYLKGQLDAVHQGLCSQFEVPRNSILMEETGGRGYHVWVFFDRPVNGQIAVRFGAALKDHLGFEIEFFPKQGCLTPSRKDGSLIKLPLGIHQKYGSRSSFFSLAPDGLNAITGTDDNLTHLRSVDPMSAETFEASVAAIPEGLPHHEESAVPVLGMDQQRPMYYGDPSVLITRCTAMLNLRAKAESATRFSRSEAFHFADVMLSVPDGADIVHDTMRLSFAGDYDRNRTQEEIDRITPLYPPSCLTLVRKGLCPEYCKESVRKKNEDPLVSGTNPCSVWLRRKPDETVVDFDNLVERIGNTENVKRSFFQLKQYHEHEDALFFDSFDFEQFEGRFEANCSMLARALLERSEMPFIGYMPVKLPKKINDAREPEYRVMSYSTVYDQTPIQAIFNGVAPVVEKDFQPTSYGYRWNTDPASSSRIFEDWREIYPHFRNDIMAALELYPGGFHFCCDIKGYYDNIDHSILIEQLRRVVHDVYVYEAIVRTVRAYTFEDKGVRGLPQGPAYARLLANLYLNDFDVFAGKMAPAYFRYVDDLVFVFETEREAEEGLELVVRRLAKLGLELSQDEAKRAVITPNTDISMIRKTLDKIRYGILEGTRHVDHLAPQAVVDFMEAVETHSVSPVNLEELIQINDALPSILYVAAQETLFSHQLQLTIVNIVEFLIQHRWFYPKKLKTIFYRLLDLESDEDRLHGLFQAMDPTHKVYFLLSVFGSWQSRSEHRTLLERLVQAGLQEESVYIFGFALAIAAKLGIDINGIISRQILMEKLSGATARFALLKWLPTVNYLDQSDEERAAIRDIIGQRNAELFRSLLISNLTKLPSVYADSVYLKGILEDDWGVLVLPVACDLLVAATDKGEVFDALSNLMVARLAFKPLVLSLVSDRIFDKRKEAGLSEIENLKSLYACIVDEELKQCMLGSLSRIKQYGLTCNEEFAKQHKLIAQYNECFLFEMIGVGGSYDYLELIPAKRLRHHIPCDLDTFRAIIDDFSAKGILPRSVVSYDSGKDEFRIVYKTEGRYLELDSGDFSLEDESVSRACALASEVYRKGCYFRRFTGKVPHISLENLLFDGASGSVVFQSVGRSLCSLHVVNGTKVGHENADIARMISTLLEKLVFKSQSEFTEFIKTNFHPGMGSFLHLFIQRLRAKDPGHRYSCPRFMYLVSQLPLPHDLLQTRYLPEVVYLRERLKGSLFRYNSEAVSWRGICRALDDHLSFHLRAACSDEALRGFPYRSRLLLSGKGKRQLHVVSKQLFDFALCRKDFPDVERSNPAYLDLLEFLLLYATICLEVLALARIRRNTDALERLVSSTLLSGDQVRVKVGDDEIKVLTKDLAALVIRQPKRETDESTAGLSLRQLSLLSLFSCSVELGNDTIIIKKPQGFREKVFQSFVQASLFRIPNIELAVEKEIAELFSTLRSNDNFDRIERLEDMRDAVNILVQDLRQVRSCIGLSRRSGHADGRYFPPDVRCKSTFRRELRVKEYALPGCPLTNSFPSSQAGYNCSWDVSDGKPMSLMIPSEGLNSLVQDLTRGKLFRFKLSYLYSGRMMAVWDGVVFVFVAIALGFCEHTKGAVTASTGAKDVCSVLTYVLGALVCVLLAKLVLIDIQHWSTRYQKPLNYILSKFKR